MSWSDLWKMRAGEGEGRGPSSLYKSLWKSSNGVSIWWWLPQVDACSLYRNVILISKRNEKLRQENSRINRLIYHSVIYFRSAETSMQWLLHQFDSVWYVDDALLALLISGAKRCRFLIGEEKNSKTQNCLMLITQPKSVSLKKQR